jgi:hypothetical protein
MAMRADDIIPLAIYGVIVVLTALGGILGPPIVLLPATGLAVFWVVMLAGHRRERR